MTLSQLLTLLAEAPLIASVQTAEGSPLDDPNILAALAKASQIEGVRLLRMEGTANILQAKQETGLPVIGLIKRSFPDSEIYITPSLSEVHELQKTECEIIALDATERPRPGGQTLTSLVSACHESGRLVLGDCDSVNSAQYAIRCGCDLVSTTLSGYTPQSVASAGPDLRLVAECSKLAPTLAEGRYSEEWEIQAAQRAGAEAVVIGGAINDSLKNTKRFMSACRVGAESVGAFDLGGTWMRFAIFDQDFRVTEYDRLPMPAAHSARIAWMTEKLTEHSLTRCGVSAGGVIHNNIVADAKGFIPDYIGQSLDLDGRAAALNDGLATAWGHAQHPAFIGQRVGTLALGSGVGAGVADQRTIFAQMDGNYPRINDLYLPDGRTIEETLGGLQIDDDPMGVAPLQIAIACETALRSILIAAPDVVILCGGVGLSEKYRDIFESVAQNLKVEIAFSPFGEHAGLYGAATLVLCRSWE